MKLSFFTRIFLIYVAVGMQIITATVRWNWSTINVNDIVLPKLCGVAMSEYQNSGATHCPDSNWAVWEKKGTNNGHCTIHGDQKSGIACDFWNNYKSDVQLVKELGCNAFRLSVEWSKIEPREGEFNQAAIDHYRDLCDELIKNGITPMITLHHFTHPQWFEAKGAFEKEKNISYFVRFCARMFEALQDKVQLWCTINEPGPYVFQGYLHAAFPPGKLLNFNLAVQVLKNMLIAHVHVYKKLKSLPGGQKAQIGLVHQYLPFEAHSWNPIEMVVGRVMSYIFNDVIMHFLKTGELFPLTPYLRATIPGAQDCNDFIGLNFYSRVVFESNILGSLWNMKFDEETFKPSCFQGEVMTDMQYPVCPEAFYEAIKAVAKLGKPIYITENGVPDSNDDRRPLFIKRYLYAMSRAMKEGCDVRGYFYWSLMDNFEWDEGYTKKFGLYEVDFATQKRILRPGAECYKRAICTSARVA